MKRLALILFLTIAAPAVAGDIRFLRAETVYLDVTELSVEPATTPRATYPGTIKGINRLQEMRNTTAIEFWSRRRFYVASNVAAYDCRQDFPNCTPMSPWYAFTLRTWVISDVAVYSVNGNRERVIVGILLVPTGMLLPESR